MATKKHFEDTATVIRQFCQQFPEREAEALWLATHLATLFKQRNDKFDRSRFLKACNNAWYGDTNEAGK